MKQISFSLQNTERVFYKTQKLGTRQINPTGIEAIRPIFLYFYPKQNIGHCKNNFKFITNNCQFLCDIWKACLLFCYFNAEASIQYLVASTPCACNYRILKMEEVYIFDHFFTWKSSFSCRSPPFGFSS